MRIAILADIHANRPALEAVVQDIAREGVDEVLVAGDLVGRGPEGSAVVEHVRRAGWPTIRGNHEDYVLNFARGDVPGNWLHAEEWAASRWMARELNASGRDFIARLPMTLTSRLAPEVRLVHGTPRSYNEGIGHWSSDAELAGHLGEIAEPVLICAHTHRPMERRLPQGYVVNVGSVGLPFNADWRAQYVILERRGQEWQALFRQVEYAREAFLETYRTSGFLHEGGLTACLLRSEVEHARPFLVPFLKWCKVRGLEAESAHLPGFLDAYDPAMSLDVFLAAFA